MVHFRREKYVPRGGPDGGDGGHGGDVILQVEPTLNTLSTFRYKHKFAASDGANGSKQKQTGKSAENLIIQVPPGTMVFDQGSNQLIGDLTEGNQQLVVCRGGRGGRGNARFATSTHQAPRIAEKGSPGEERNLRLELKLIADVGIIGVPNAGKSTLLAAVTDAKPKIAAYPFTTLEPNLGVVDLDEYTSLVLADIPGLIEGAHRGVGLGHDFLRHIQRTKVLIHLLDGLSANPLLDLAQINSELALFDPNLALKPQVVALNKIDLPDVQERWPQVEASLKKVFTEKGMRVASQPIAISAVAGTNVRRLLGETAKILAEIEQAPVSLTTQDEIPVYRPESDPRAFQIRRDSDGWHVNGESIERAAAMTYWEYDDSVRRFQSILKTIGIEEALRKAGVQQGDTVFIGEYELEWQD